MKKGKNMKTADDERRDWGIVIFIIPIGIILLLIAGQIAVRMIPHWSLFANMRSGLDPMADSAHPSSLFQPILPQILTPMAWSESYLTPGGDISFPPFVVFDPGFTSTPTPKTPRTVTPNSTMGATNTPAAPTSTPYIFIPSPTSSGGGNTSVPATNTSAPPPQSTNTSTNTPTPSSTSTPTDTATATSSPTNTSIPGNPSTVPPPSGEVTAPPDVTNPPDNNPFDLAPGNYTIIDVSANPVIVSNSYNIIFYEYDVGGNIRLDQIIIGIMVNAADSYYYQVFNWGDNIADSNTNADFNILPPDGSPTCLEPECDNRIIPLANLYPYPGTGIVIDVDTAPSLPPPGVYNYIIIISPLGGDGDAAQIDSIQIVP
jgi:hypothetical protein